MYSILIYTVYEDMHNEVRYKFHIPSKAKLTNAPSSKVHHNQ